MEHKFFSPYKACYIFGMLNLVVVTIIYIIFSCIPCENKSICLVEYNGDVYIGQILKIFSIFGVFMLLIMIAKAIIKILMYITINKFSIFHCFLLINFTYIIDEVDFRDSDYLYLSIIINSIIFIFGTFFILVFLEIIELNICGMSYNTKKNIEKRAIFDAENFVLNGDETSNDEIEKDDDISMEEFKEINKK